MMGLRNAYWLCDPVESNVLEFANLPDALAAGKDWIQNYRDDCDPEWPEGVTQLCIVYGSIRELSEDGVWVYRPLVAKVVEVNRQDRPADEEEREASGLDWSVDFYCDYEMQEVAGAQANDSSAS